MAETRFDVVIRNGTLYDGTGAPGRRADVGIRDGKVAAIRTRLEGTGAKEIDATGCWVTPGFFDLHTHYDAEIEVLPSLDESVRHGVTSIVMGNCSLSAAAGTDEQLLDLFCRVESLPRPLMEKWLNGNVRWKGPKEYYEHLESLPIGPNVATFLGHSNVRLAAMGTERALREPKATPAEKGAMKAMIREALDAGFLGLSIDMLPWHRWDGEAYKGISVPSQQAHPSEYEELADVVRDAGGVLQATPNALMKQTVLRILSYSVGRAKGRKPLKTTIVAAMDVKTDRKIYKIAQMSARFVTEVLGGDVRFQALAEPFLNYCDGVHTPLFEEFPTGVEAISATAAERRRMFSDPAFRKRFRKEWTAKGQRVFHRDLGDMLVIAAPDASLVGKSFRQIARERGEDEVECLMDLLRDHDSALRFKTEVTNDRPGPRRELMASPYTLPGFNDSGAHNRNMAFQDGALQLLQQMQAHPEVMSIEQAVHRLTGEIAGWLGLDAGVIAEGQHADVVVIDPQKLPYGLSRPIELDDPRLDGHMRMVKRSDGVVREVVIGGRVAFEAGSFAPDFGKTKYGRLLRRGGLGATKKASSDAKGAKPEDASARV